jgi:hypothetical protein
MSVTPDELRKLLRAAPFRPFRLHLADQRTFDVLHPEFVAIQPAGRWIVVVAPSELGGYEVVNLPLIVSMTVMPEPPASQQRRERSDCCGTGGPRSSGNWAPVAGTRLARCYRANIMEACQ